MTELRAGAGDHGGRVRLGDKQLRYGGGGTPVFDAPLLGEPLCTMKEW